MAYEVLARKWRPKQFDDVVGQEHVTRTLRNAIESDRVAHAYLFIGPRGIGKTSLSRLFAKALNCEKGPTGEPCDTCAMCREIATGSSLDVIEIDAASNTGVDHIRDLRDQVQFAPTRGKYRIFIIDEVHMLSNAAFNALLKTLEEPPPHVKFIFATTEGDKVLPTIISRCQRFDLRRIQTGMIVRRLRHICDAESITITDDALLAIARGAEGGLRDALSALDQLISFKGTSLTEEDVLAVFGLISREALEKLATAILEGDIPAILRLVAHFDDTGKDMRRFLSELMGHFRNLLVYQQAGGDLARSDATDDQIASLAAQAKLADPSRIIQIAELLADAESKLRYSLSVRTLVEMTLIRSARAAKTVSLDEIIRRIAALRTGAPQAQAPTAPAPAPAAAPAQPAPKPPPPEAEAPAAASEISYKDPIVNTAKQLFNGEVTAVEPL